MRTHRKLAVLLSGMTIVVASACSGGGSTNVEPIELGSETGASQTTSSTATGNEETGVEVGTKETITILIDGWSMAGIAAGSITWEDTTGVDMGPLATAPAEEGDLEAAAKKDPEAVRNLMARIVTGDPTLECGDDGCSTKDREISYKELLEPTTGAVLGGLYQDYGIETGVYVAKVSAEATNLKYGGDTYNISQTTAEEAVLLGTKPGTGVVAVGVGFGSIFPLNAEWLGGKTAYTVRPFVKIGENRPVSVAAETMLSGLGTSNPGVNNLTAGQLTWRTSPTTGCGVGVLCVPGIAQVESVETEKQIFKVCKGADTGIIEMGAVDISYTYKGRTNQFGVWGEGKPSGVVAERAVIWTSEPAYVVGASKQHHVYAYLYDDFGLYDTTGRVSTIGLDPESDTKYVPGAEYLQKIFGGAWKTC